MPSFHLRIDDDLHAALKAAAAQDHRSINSEIVYLLELGLAARKRRTA